MISRLLLLDCSTMRARNFKNIIAKWNPLFTAQLQSDPPELIDATIWVVITVLSRLLRQLGVGQAEACRDRQGLPRLGSGDRQCHGFNIEDHGPWCLGKTRHQEARRDRKKDAKAGRMLEWAVMLAICHQDSDSCTLLIVADPQIGRSRRADFGGSDRSFFPELSPVADPSTMIIDHWSFAADATENDVARNERQMLASTVCFTASLRRIVELKSSQS
ncbi:hypothetical protein B0T14DRAFT_604256 [Immersiella caudata]|uniref:Uncharacterized protein n=1 Tax=Immersiella caudata TaxID=314043 RepID=A0AA39WSD9_9PEZI|nr:hypothetical protein B0T14DRAFT_604256 [Immersiella caudata]